MSEQLWSHKLFLVYCNEAGAEMTAESLRALEINASPELAEEIRKLTAASRKKTAGRLAHGFRFDWTSLYPGAFFSRLMGSRVVLLLVGAAFLATAAYDISYYQHKQEAAKPHFKPFLPAATKFLADRIQLGMRREDVEKIFRKRAGGTQPPDGTLYLVNIAIIEIGYDATGGPDGKENRVNRLPTVKYLMPV